MLVELAIGDAYGAGFEFSSMEKIKQFNDGEHYERHDLGQIANGCYTDDTQMSIAVAELIVDSSHLSRGAFADAFVSTYRRDPRAGYAEGFKELLQSSVNGTDLLARIHPNSRRNGAAMRAIPIGLLPNEESVLEAASASASVSHDTVEGIQSAQVIALMAHGLAYCKTDLKHIIAYVNQFVAMVCDAGWTGYVNCDAIETTNAVCTMLLSHSSMHELLVDCVGLGGDTDSVASIALGLASLTNDYEHDLRPSLLTGLERGPFGFDYLRKLDQRIFSKYSLLTMT